MKDVRRENTSSSTSTRASVEDTKRLAAEAADKLLAHPVIESYRIEVRTLKFAVVVFPGSNSDHDAHCRRQGSARQYAELIWHKARARGRRAVILPGASPMVTLRTGAIRALFPHHAGGKDPSPLPRAGARHLNGFQLRSRPACFRAQCSETAAFISAASTCLSM